ncbi:MULTISPECIES: MDR family MFS transporter [Staphylococcus]|uniref:Transporter, major facilitator family protein n=2 Tax=Staphylococcus lugdunensis TaxID=28035 RepID=A0ABD4EIN1_STALU|nr:MULTISPECIES: MFS transporter [Staphylococcus]ARB77522.1 MFS transporter [Staphylococcus lugdunensis]ARJ18635.1 MFS transporter [Staphylococcus lugdunensis]ARJ26732.1 MFS transporter [Staphylococcus lugdunensis]EFU85332.1 transporter, major facilitator family protein [Staphylococcus lugdunensis M23590]KXA40200.1 transporter, major facilitator family protein [Staphylococcus lugdunensis]
MNIPKSVWMLVIGMALNITGSSFLWPLNTIYMKEELDKSLTIAGIVLMINSFGMVVGNLLGGSLFDKLGGYRTILTGTAVCLVSTTMLNFFHGWPLYAVWLVMLGFGGGMIVPAIYAMAGAVWPNGGRQTFNAIYLAQNIGVALGAALGGFVAELSFNYIFIANLLMYVLFAIVAVTQFNLEYSVKMHKPDNLELENKDQKRRFKALILLCIMFSICWIAYIQWESTIASFTQDIDISMSQYSILWTVNGIMILVAQPLISPVIRILKGNIKKQMIVGIIIFMVSFLVTSFAEQFSVFLIGMIILTFGEMFVWPAVPTIANFLAPDGKQGQYQGFVNSASTVGKAFGPLIGGILVDAFNMSTMFIGMIVLLSIALCFLAVFDKNMPKDKTI